jgi:fatty acid desaturase
MSETAAPSARGFSAVEARPLVADLFVPNPAVYWTDFLLSIGGGHLCFGLVRLLPWLLPGLPWLAIPLRVVAFAACCLLYYRAAMFIHELVHLKRGTFLAFRCAWNLLCGIPLLMPSFVYHPHVEHHRRSRYGTHSDAEYLPLGHSPPWHILAYFLRPFVTPFLVVVRFALLTPLSWVSPAVARWVYRHASSVVMNPGYLRPPPARGALRVLRLEEALCFFWCAGLVVLPVLFLHRLPTPLLIQAYLTAVCVLVLNGLRTLGQHRWGGQGQEMTMDEQLLDSVNYPRGAPITEFWGPVGLRFHALHHVFPTLPYHALPEAHRRLMSRLPPDSPYRRTEEESLHAALVDVWRRARRSAGQTADNSSGKPTNLQQEPAIGGGRSDLAGRASDR